MGLIELKKGLPNTCSVCGADPGATWFAVNAEQARAGQGKCRTCAFPQPARQAEPEHPDQGGDAEKAESKAKKG